MRNKTAYFCVFLSLTAMTACATVPSGPSVLVVPPPGKPFELFKQEEALCRRWAEQQTGVSSQEAVNKNTTTGAMVGTAVGAGLGALTGAASGHAGAGALIGGAAGMLVGAASGADSGQMYGREAQRRYDIAYLQCMYANDNQFVRNNRMMRRNYRTNALIPPPPVTRLRSYEPIPPPPPGSSPQTPPELMENEGVMR